jgi:hypothetical protein
LIFSAFEREQISLIYVIMNSFPRTDFRTGQNLFPFATTPRYSLSEIETELRKNQALGKNPPSRNYFHALCEDGTLDAVLTSRGYLVKQESFWEWLREMTEVAA